MWTCGAGSGTGADGQTGWVAEAGRPPAPPPHRPQHAAPARRCRASPAPLLPALFYGCAAGTAFCSTPTTLWLPLPMPTPTATLLLAGTGSGRHGIRRVGALARMASGRAGGLRISAGAGAGGMASQTPTQTRWKGRQAGVMVCGITILREGMASHSITTASRAHLPFSLL